MADFTACVLTLCRSHPEFSVRQIGVLLHVYTGAGKELRHIAEALNVPKPSIIRACDKLERLGLVSRAVPKEDRRKCLLALTPQGLGLLQSVGVA